SAQDIGSLGQNVALSLVAGSWKLNADGNIYLQEVRNPNGVFDQPQSINSPAYHYFDYDPNASVDLTAGNGVYLLGQSLPRPNGAVPVIFPPSLDIMAGSGGVNLETSIILFPSPNQNLQITTTGQGDLVGLTPNATLSMSDSGQTRFVGSETFGTSDHASTPPELNNPNLVMLNINGNMKDLSLVTDKPTQIKVGGDMTDCSFSGENLHAGDKTSITVTGNIFNQGSFNSVFLTDPVPLLSQADSSSHTINNWEGILAAAVNPDKIAAVTVPGGVSPSDYYANYVAPNLQYGGSLGSFFYNATTGRLTFVGSMDGGLAAALQQPLTVVRYDGNGNPVVINGKIQTDQVNWIPATAIQSLYVASQGAPLLSSGGNGYQIGGPGEFDITAKTISLGNTQGILSYGAGGNYGNLARYVQSGGASIVVKTQGDLDLPSSTIAALSSGNVDVESLAGSMDLGSQDLLDVENLVVHYHGIALGIYSTGGGDVTVKALHNINVDSSRIAAFNGGKVTVESYQGDVNAGSGGTASIPVYVYYVDPVTGQPNFYLEQVFASGIVTETLVNSASVPGAANAPGNITVTTPQGNINASEGGILQEALNGNVSAGPTVTLSAGSDGFVKDVNLGNSGVIGGTVNVTATGNVTGLVISRQDSSINAAQNFSGTVLSGGTANLSAGGTASGVVIGIGGVNASSSQSGNLVALGQNVSVNGGPATSTLGTTSGPSATATSAGADSDNQAQKQTAGLENSDNDDTKKKNGLASSLGRLVKRVTIIL
ncbi:MAG TPA: hypothetical protein VFC07_07810, partial [Verrucomicrobiae bacterium]|nr:hypothetical protein [Verrucomicrobiae bacterium]